MDTGYVKVLKRCTIEGRRFKPGAIVRVDPETAREMFRQRAAVPAGEPRQDGHSHLTRART